MSGVYSVSKFDYYRRLTEGGDNTRAQFMVLSVKPNFLVGMVRS